MSERMVTTSRDTLDAAVAAWIRDVRCKGSIVDYLIDSGAVRVIDPADPELVERTCEVMHDAYEAAATETGWETQQRSRKSWADVPKANKATMRLAVRAAIEAVLR